MTEATDPMAKARAAKAAKAAAQIAAPDKPVAEMTEDEVREYRRQVLDLLKDIPNPDVPKDAVPGSLFGEGPIKDKKDFNAEWFKDVAARRKDRDKDGNLIWPDYDIVWFIPAKDDIVRVNGVGFAIYAGRRCGLPSPHYTVYVDNLQSPQRLKEAYDPPVNPGREAGYVSPVHRMGTGFFHTAEQAAALDKNS